MSAGSLVLLLLLSSARLLQISVYLSILDGRTLMKHFTFFLVALAMMAGLVALIAPAPGRADGEPAPIFVNEIPHGYRDWKWIAVAHEAGNLNRDRKSTRLNSSHL